VIPNDPTSPSLVPKKSLTYIEPVSPLPRTFAAQKRGRTELGSERRSPSLEDLERHDNPYPDDMPLASSEASTRDTAQRNPTGLGFLQPPGNQKNQQEVRAPVSRQGTPDGVDDAISFLSDIPSGGLEGIFPDNSEARKNAAKFKVPVGRSWSPDIMDGISKPPPAPFFADPRKEYHGRGRIERPAATTQMPVQGFTAVNAPKEDCTASLAAVIDRIIAQQEENSKSQGEESSAVTEKDAGKTPSKSKGKKIANGSSDKKNPTKYDKLLAKWERERKKKRMAETNSKVSKKKQKTKQGPESSVTSQAEESQESEREETSETGAESSTPKKQLRKNPTSRGILNQGDRAYLGRAKEERTLTTIGRPTNINKAVALKASGLIRVKKGESYDTFDLAAEACVGRDHGEVEDIVKAMINTYNNIGQGQESALTGIIKVIASPEFKKNMGHKRWREKFGTLLKTYDNNKTKAERTLQCKNAIATQWGATALTDHWLEYDVKTGDQWQVLRKAIRGFGPVSTRLLVSLEMVKEHLNKKRATEKMAPSRRPALARHMDFKTRHLAELENTPNDKVSLREASNALSDIFAENEGEFTMPEGYLITHNEDVSPGAGRW
jgi:hypothetical protein